MQCLMWRYRQAHMPAGFSDSQNDRKDAMQASRSVATYRSLHARLDPEELICLSRSSNHPMVRSPTQQRLRIKNSHRPTPWLEDVYTKPMNHKTPNPVPLRPLLGSRFHIHLNLPTNRLHTHLRIPSLLPRPHLLQSREIHPCIDLHVFSLDSNFASRRRRIDRARPLPRIGQLHAPRYRFVHRAQIVNH